MQKAGADGALKTPNATPDALSPDHLVVPHGGRAVELFAGVGGFRIGLERTGWSVVLGNQWEPSTRVQHAFDCYLRHFEQSGGEDVNEDIAVMLDEVESGDRTLPDFELLVGGFPCQDYSVAKLLNQAHGIQGKKGVLWWQIHRLIEMSSPRLVFLENVDRLLKSPAAQRGRDFAIMLASLSDLGYAVEWRVINAADYGHPQRRRRVLIVARRSSDLAMARGADLLYRSGVLARAFEVVQPTDHALLDGGSARDLHLSGDLVALTRTFDSGGGRSPFENGGVMIHRDVWTRHLEPEYAGPRLLLGDILEDEAGVPQEFFIPEAQLDAWRYLKGAKREERVHKASGMAYCYNEGPLPFPDPLDRPARTVLTAEGGTSPSRFKHVVATPSGRYRRLTPVELERINEFPDGWTEGMTPGKRAFCMGNALVVGLIEQVGRVLADELARLTIPA
jgi:DNA (cytosine-5)-methyltransferase 1